MRTTLFTFYFFIGIITGFSQKNKIYKGIVKDHNSQETIPFATVAIYKNDKLIDGTSTSDIGQFQLKTKKEITHFKISFIGRETSILAYSEITDPKNIIIFLKTPINELDEVFVKAEQTTTQLKIDRKIINLGADLQQSGTTALEAFDQISEIQTDLGSGTLSLRGSGNVRLLINGKPSALNATELLEQIPSSSIQKVEIITSPSAKNQADGLSGIINIILKKNSAQGLNLTLNTGVGTKRYNYGIDGNYNFSPINFRWNASQSGREMDSKQTINQQYLNGNTRDFFTPHDYNGLIRTIASGIDFFINDKNELSFDFNHTNDYHTFYNNTFYTNVTGREDYIYTRNSSHTHKTTNFNINHRTNFNKQGHYIEFDYNLTKNKNILPAIDFEDRVLLFNEEQKNNNTLHALALDYTLPIGEKTQIETGFSWNGRKLRSYNYFNPIQETASTDVFNYNENLLGIYALAKFNTGKLSWQTGLRYEHFISDSDNTLNGQATNQKFSDLFPSIHASYEVDETNSLNIGYSKRVSRPNFHHINPFQMGNQFFQWVANPNLKPEFSDNFEINYQYNNNKFNASVSTFYRYRTDVIEWLSDINEDGVQSISFDNIGKKHSYGIETDIRYKITQHWNAQLSGNYYLTNIDQDIYLTWNQLYSSSIILKNTFKINKNISTDITYRHTPKDQRAFNYREPRNRFDWAVRLKLLDNKLTASFRIIDVFDNNLMYRNTITQDIIQNEVWRFQSQTFGVLFSVNYKLFQNEGKIRNRKERDYQHNGTTD
ncbi:outer membrane beta-barrel family protein [Aquimarina sp. MMG016]|uniref:outer membrane beta-barrel family protein n=1 Tax=Aquimarina sp. MMG016 TaxID=2822690 RepID=UPI001B3A4B91|nr:outer membrane beta-barrel family protein [Aquimarina sp. MMG016]MBQ4821166.1 TonB-dependent receptor [Aquimarina sp. MMG016]